MALQSNEQVKALADQIRSGELTGKEAENAMQQIRDYTNNGLASDDPGIQEEKKNFISRMADNVEKRQMMFTDIVEAQANGEQTYAESTMQVAGKFGAGLVMDFIGEATVSAGRGLSLVTPDLIEDPIKAGATGVGLAFLNTAVGQAGADALGDGVESYRAWAAQNPRAARNIEAVVDVGMLLAPVKLKPKATPKSNAFNVSDRIRGSADKTDIVRRDKFINDLTAPPATKRNLEAQVARGGVEERGILRQQKAVPTTSEVTAADAVSSLSTVKPTNSVTKNTIEVLRAIENEGAVLAAKVKKHDVPYNLNEYVGRLTKIRDELADSIVVTGDAVGSGTKIIDDTITLLNKKPIWKNSDGAHGRISDLLQIRKDIDKAFKDAGRPPSPKAASGTAENGQALAIRRLRRETNDFIAEKVPDAGVKHSLRRQSALYRAADNMIPKAAAEGNNILKRAWDVSAQLLPIRGSANQAGALVFGVGGLGAGAILGPFLSGALFGGAAGYGLWRGLSSPATRRGIATLLDGNREMMRAAKNSASKMAELRAIRAGMLELLEWDENLQSYAAPTSDEINTIEVIGDAEKKERYAKAKQNESMGE